MGFTTGAGHDGSDLRTTVAIAYGVPGVTIERALSATRISQAEIGQRLYVSRRTVQTHLAHIFAKLQISSRAQLAAEATRRQAR
jgi:hypothetical protein